MKHTAHIALFLALLLLPTGSVAEVLVNTETLFRSVDPLSGDPVPSQSFGRNVGQNPGATVIAPAPASSVTLVDATEASSASSSSAVASAVSSSAPAAAPSAPTETAGGKQQDFIITAYYSPLPDQCCYVKGSFEEDVILNGRGTNAADGTPVYPGMLAAPTIYPFGTRIELPGIGVGVVHDRGGAIVELKDKNVHRLDLWAGVGEEGLARALAFGVRHVRGSVYPQGIGQPSATIDLASLPAPLSMLKPFMVQQESLLAVLPHAGDRGAAVQDLQEQLKGLGYLTVETTGFFGEETKRALESFLTAMDLDEPSDRVTETSASYLLALRERGSANGPLEEVFVEAGSASGTIYRAERTLRFLGFYRGRTDGKYTERLRDAIVAFQKEAKLIGDAASPGAGKIGPITRAAIFKSWQKKLLAFRAKKILLLHKIDQLIAQRKERVASFLAPGQKGTDVRALQRFLALKGLLPTDKVSGFFGTFTKQALTAYQLTAGLITSTKENGAGTVGPATLRSIAEEQRNVLYGTVRSYGWDAL
jgi:peptidoglycan hydrolase-like protein with peptidoglycan-binding domain/3D (Asp-Asp-Asp) domain-containing protein